MVSRRNFFVSVAALATEAVFPNTVKSEELPPREFHRFDYATNTWAKLASPYDIKPKDVIWVFDPPDGFSEVVLVSRTCPEEGLFYSVDRIDKTTNKWRGEA